MTLALFIPGKDVDIFFLGEKAEMDSVTVPQEVIAEGEECKSFLWTTHKKLNISWTLLKETMFLISGQGDKFHREF